MQMGRQQKGDFYENGEDLIWRLLFFSSQFILFSIKFTNSNNTKISQKPQAQDGGDAKKAKA